MRNHTEKNHITQDREQQYWGEFYLESSLAEVPATGNQVTPGVRFLVSVLFQQFSEVNCFSNGVSRVNWANDGEAAATLAARSIILPILPILNSQ